MLLKNYATLPSPSVLPPNLKTVSLQGNQAILQAWNGEPCCTSTMTLLYTFELIKIVLS